MKWLCVVALLWAGTASAVEPCAKALRVQKDGSFILDGVQYSKPDALAAKLAAYRKKGCEIHLVAGKDVGFEAVGSAVAAMQKAGILKVGYLTEPRR